MTESPKQKRQLRSTALTGLVWLHFVILSGYSSLVWLPIVLLSGCSSSTTPGGTSGEGQNREAVIKENATTGEITIGVDETLQPLGRQMVNTFMDLYPDGSIHVKYRSEYALFQNLIEDSVRLILAGRDLTEAEKNRILMDQVVPKTRKLGTDAIVVVMHPDNPHDSLSHTQLDRILRGQLNRWEEIDSSQSGEVVLVFDQAKTGTLRFLKQLFLPEADIIQGKAYAAKGHEDLVNYVSTNPAVIGFIGASWITDRDQPQVKDFLSKVKLARLEASDSSDIPGQFVRPYQAEIALKRYPLCRTFYAHSREHFSGLGTGFVVFAAGDQGQRIILKAGLNPENPQPRYLIFPEMDNEDND